MVGDERIGQNRCSMRSTTVIMYKSLSSDLRACVSLSDVFMCIVYVCAYLCWCRCSSVCVHESQNACLSVSVFEIWANWFH